MSRVATSADRLRLAPRPNWRCLTAIAPFLFLTHDLEEAFQTERMNELMAEFGPRLPRPLSARLTRVHYTTSGLAAVGVAAFVGQATLTLTSRRDRRTRRLLVALLVARACNALMHVAESLAMRRYVPGTATAPLMIALSTMALRSMRREQTA